MQDLFDLTPELLLEQSQEMSSLCAAYDSLFSSISSDLNGINGSWSDLLSNNFSGKIGSAQKTFSGTLNMLQNSAGSIRAVAQTAQEMDAAWSAKIGGSMFNPDGLSGLISAGMFDTLQEDYQKARELINLVASWREDQEGKLTSSQAAWLKEIEKLVDKQISKGGITATAKILTKIGEEDYLGAIKDLAKTVMTPIAKESLKGNIDVSGGFGLIDEGDAAKYYWNLGWGVGTATGEFAMEPSFENAGKIAWNATVQPVLDTAGSKIESVIKQIPGISEYYYDENGAEDIGDAAGIALGDFYSLFSADEGIRDYAANYYKEGIWEGLWGGFEDIGSFIKDSGGAGEAAKSFFGTAWKDTKADWSAFVENMSYLVKGGSDAKAVNVPLDSTNL